jgi:hypothetical protein
MRAAEPDTSVRRWRWQPSHESHTLFAASQNRESSSPPVCLPACDGCCSASRAALLWSGTVYLAGGRYMAWHSIQRPLTHLTGSSRSKRRHTAPQSPAQEQQATHPARSPIAMALRLTHKRRRPRARRCCPILSCLPLHLVQRPPRASDKRSAQLSAPTAKCNTV